METFDLKTFFFDVATMVGDWRFYPFALGICVFLCAAMTWNSYPLRVSAFVFSFSVWFAIGWGVGIGSLAPHLRRNPPNLSDPFVFGFLGLLFLPFALFAVCAIASLYLYVTNRSIEPRSRTAVRLGVALVSAHLLHSLFLLLGAGFPIDAG